MSSTGNTSYWIKTADQSDRKYPALDKDIETETLVVGGGITGVTCAYNLAANGMKGILIESGNLCSGTTGNTTGKVTMQHGTTYSKLLKLHGTEKTFSYAGAQSDAVNFIKHSVEKEGISCGLRETSAYVYAENEKQKKSVLDEFEAEKKLGIRTSMIKTPSFPKSLCMCGMDGQYDIHPVNYVYGLAKAAGDAGFGIFCGTKLTKLEDGDTVTANLSTGAVIHAHNIIMATQFPIYEGFHGYFARLYPMRTYAVAVKAKRDFPDGCYISAGDPTHSVRSFDTGGGKILIVVGESHYTSRGGDMESHYRNLLRFADEIAGVESEVARWSAQDYMTPDGLPYIGRISRDSNVFIAAGFGKWGLTNGALAGMMIPGLILNGKNRYEKLMSPLRPDVTAGIGKITAEVTMQVGELLKSKIKNTESIENIKNGEGRVINFKGKKAGLYIAVDGTATVLDISCTHMGTELNWNDAEKTWDCPAHGGRFTSIGKLIEGPPEEDLPILFQGNEKELRTR